MLFGSYILRDRYQKCSRKSKESFKVRKQIDWKFFLNVICLREYDYKSQFMTNTVLHDVYKLPHFICAKKMTFELKIYVRPSCEREPAFEGVLSGQLKISRQFGVK